jgi:hypothetical protein
MKIDTFSRTLLHISLAALMVFAPLVASATTQAPEPFVIGERFQIESNVLKETRTYVIHTPPCLQPRERCLSRARAAGCGALLRAYDRGC